MLATAIVSGKRIPWDKQESSDDLDSMSSSSGELEDEGAGISHNHTAGGGPSLLVDSELAQIMMEIISIIDCLFRLSISVQNPAPHDRFRAATTADASYEPFDIAHVRAKFSHASNAVVERLGKANAHRRQYFRYREDHHRKLASGLGTDIDAGKSTVASSIPTRLKTNSGGDAASFGVLYEDQRSDTGYSQTSFATSAAPDLSERLRVPSIPDAHTGGPFECPFCLMIISVSTKSAWK